MSLRGGRPGGIGAGIYVVWPAFYTDVTDAYRLPRPARLRTDLGGIYFNAVVAVLALGVWLATGLDVLLLLIGLQMLEIVKNLSPVIRSDGYHILSDATGVPDLYAHMGPTLKRLLPGKRREPSALKGSARALVTAWVLVIVPILLAMAFSAILLFPKLAASSWESGHHLLSRSPARPATPTSSGCSRRWCACSRWRSRWPARPSSPSACSARRGARPGAGARAGRRARRWCSPARPG